MSRAGRGALVVFAKEPRPGFAKTRMTPPLSPQQAAELYESLLLDALDASARSCAALGLETLLYVDPPEATARLAALALPGFRVIAQRGANLGQRLDWAAREAAAGGARPILLRGSDSPTLGSECIRAALEALEEVDVVVCPDRDGGYNLVGIRRPVSGLFDHPMSTSRVLQDTLANARARGLRTHQLASGFDLDTISDLRWLARARSPSIAKLCPRTLDYLDRNRLWSLSRTH